jgi:hypothetical protein
MSCYYPRPAQYQATIHLSQQLEQHGTDFTLADDQAFPHLSLYMANLTPENLAKAKSALAKIAARVPALPLTATDYAHDYGQGMFEIRYEMPDTLVRLQSDIIATLNPLRTGLREKDPVGHVLAEWLPKLTGEARQNYDAYGYDEIGGLFRPHITLTRFKQRDFTVDVATLPAPTTLSTTFDTLGLYEMVSMAPAYAKCLLLR